MLRLGPGSPELERAQKLYNLTDFEGSLRILNAIPVKDAAVSAWIGRNLYMQTDYKKASEFLERAFAQDPSSSEIALWAGRAFGRRAETSSMFTAPGFASKARSLFEKSVELNPHNLEALADLFEYYLEAPGFLGGGVGEGAGHRHPDRSRRRRRGTLCPGPARRETEAVQRHRRAPETSRGSRAPADRPADRLAKFLAKEGRVQESDQNLAKAEKLNPNSPKLLYAKADLYIKQKRNLDVAKDLPKAVLEPESHARRSTSLGS